MTADQVAATLGISARKVYDLAAPAGPLPCTRIGRRVVFDEADVLEFKAVWPKNYPTFLASVFRAFRVERVQSLARLVQIGVAGAQAGAHHFCAGSFPRKK